MSIGSNLRRYRLLNNLSLRDVAEMMGLSHTVISKYENNILIPDSKKIIKFSKIYNVQPDNLLKLYAKPDLEFKSFRKLSSLSGRKLELLKEIFGIEISNYIEVINLANYNNIFKIEKHFIKSLSEVEEFVETFKKGIELSNNQPVTNLINLLENIGIFIIEIKLPKQFDNLDGLSEIVNDIPFIIIRGDYSDGARKRFTLAHELAHLLLKFDNKIEQKEIEKYCNKFASCFLLPKDAMIREFSSKRKKISFAELDSIKKEYKASHAAIIYRLKDLGIISDNYAKKWFINLNRKYGKVDPYPIEPERGNLYKNLVYRLKSENIISESKANELLKEKWETDFNCRY